jgi:hypothetical protein
MPDDQTFFRDSPPEDPTLTDYDRVHLISYLKLLDCEAAGLGWAYAARHIFSLPESKCDSAAELMYAKHLARAEWMTRSGYLELLREQR